MFDALLAQKGLIFLLYILNFIVPTFYIYILYRSLHDRIATTQNYLNRLKEGAYEVIPSQEARDEIGGMVQSYNLW